MSATATFSIDPRGACYFGAGAINQLPGILEFLEQRRAFLVTDRGVVAAGVSGKIERILEHAGIELGIFDDIQSNPSTRTLDAGGHVIRAFGEGVVIAVGGGAVMDVAKGLAVMAVNQGGGRDLDFSREPERPGLPLIAVPTTSGTGSETNAFGVIDDHEAGRKFYVGHHSVAPRFVVLDPELTLDLPHGATAAAGMDALSHALESLSSIRGNPYADALNMQVVTMVARSLPRAVANGHDLEARSDLLLSAYMAGLAMGTTGLGMAHAIGHALSARIGAPHGVALAVLLPHVLTFNLPVRKETYARLAGPLNVLGGTLDEADRAQASIDAVCRLLTDVGLPRWLGELGCTEAHIPLIVEDALSDSVIVNTPRMPTAEELTVVLHNAL